MNMQYFAIMMQSFMENGYRLHYVIEENRYSFTRIVEFGVFIWSPFGHRPNILAWGVRVDESQNVVAFNTKTLYIFPSIRPLPNH